MALSGCLKFGSAVQLVPVLTLLSVMDTPGDYPEYSGHGSYWYCPPETAYYYDNYWDYPPYSRQYPNNSATAHPPVHSSNTNEETDSENESDVV